MIAPVASIHTHTRTAATLSPALQALGWCLRIITGCAFIYSGFVKAVDPYGTLYKLIDYAGALSLTLPDNLLLGVAFLLFGIEFVVGVMLLTGCFRRMIPISAAAIMAFMLPLSIWLALANPVSDCGCFGDAWHISNWATMWKNVLLSCACVWLIRFNNSLHWIITPALQWIALVATGILIMGVAVLGYNVQPPLDFRPYPVGTTLLRASGSSGPTSEPQLIYTKDGKTRAFALTDDIPDDWDFVERRQQPDMTSNNGLTVYDMYDNDITLEVLSDSIPASDRRLIMMMPAVSDTQLRYAWSINALNEWAGTSGVDFFAVIAADTTAIGAWRDLSLAEYPIYTAEDTSIKEIVRGNPALVALRGDTIIWKRSMGTLSIDRFVESNPAAADLDTLPDDFSSTGTPPEVWMERVYWGYGLVMIILVIAGFTPGAIAALRKCNRVRSGNSRLKT